MRIEELLTENQQLDEIGIGDAARKVGAGIGNVANAASSVAGGALGAWDQMKAGFQKGRGVVGGKAAPAAAQAAAKPAQVNDPNAGQSNSTQGNVQTTPPVQAAPNANALAPNAAAAPQTAPQKMNVQQVMAIVDKLNMGQKKALAARLGQAMPQPKPATAPAAPATGAADAAAPLANVAESRRSNVLDFHSKFLGRAI